MIPFLFNENQFSFFVADHLLVGQLCTNSKSDRSLLSCLKVTQCSTSEIGDAPLYNSCSLPIQVYDNRIIASTLKIQIWIATNNRGHGQGDENKSFQLQLWSLVWFQVRVTSCHLTSLKSAWKSTPKVYLDVLKSVVIPWCNQMASKQTLDVAAGLGAGPQVQRDPGLTLEGVLRLSTLLSLAPLFPWPESAGLLRLVIHREHQQYDLHNTKASLIRRHPPSICQTPTGACGKGMLPVSGSVLRLKVATLNRCQLYYIIKLPELIFFNKCFKIKL